MITLNLRVLGVVLIALVLTIIPLPDIAASFRPPWVLLVVLYLQFFLPNYFHLVLLFLLGLCLDVLLYTVIGEHAFALLFIAWLAYPKARRFHFFSMGKQMGLIALFCLTYQFVLFLIDSFLGHNTRIVMVAGSAILSLLFWPWVRVLLDNTLVRVAHKRRATTSR